MKFKSLKQYSKLLTTVDWISFFLLILFFMAYLVFPQKIHHPEKKDQSPGVFNARADSTDTLDTIPLQRLIQEAYSLLDHTPEGIEEGQVEAGSRQPLLNAIADAEQILLLPDLTEGLLDTTLWNLADSCVTFETKVRATDIGLIDPLATKETKYLYTNLDQMAGHYTMFGMHDATGYGVGWTDDDERSDVKDVCGSYPAVYSEDLNKVERNIDIDRLHYRLTSAYNRGGVITTSWHQYDPLNRSFYAADINYEKIVPQILPGGEYHHTYKAKLWKIALFLKTLRGQNGESIPVIFRPYHEHTGGWFWWGAGQCTKDEYNQLWRFTVEYLRDSLNVHNLIYALSPGAGQISSNESYFNIYPGDEYIDVFGLDNYFSANILSSEKEEFIQDIRRLCLVAYEKAKIAGLTEVGQENITNANLFTEFILKPLKTDEMTRRATYIAVWRNASTSHHFAPYPGHASVPDFLNFFADPLTLFEDDLPPMYILPEDTIPPQITDYPAQPLMVFDTKFNLHLKTDERASLRWAYSDLSYAMMPYEFQNGQGQFYHSTEIQGDHGQTDKIFIRAADHRGNALDQALEITYSIDTLKLAVEWNEQKYKTDDWIQGDAPIHFDSTSSSGTAVPQSRTVYLRKFFSINNPDSLYQLVCFIQYDNGFIFYLNGKEIRRVNIPEGEVDYQTWAGGSSTTFSTITLDKSVLHNLVPGKNILGMEVHQTEMDSSDLKFDLKMIDPEVVIDYGESWEIYSKKQKPPLQIISTIWASNQETSLPKSELLYQNYPNPFNLHTTVGYQLTGGGKVTVRIFDLLGRQIQTLVDEPQNAGFYSLIFDGSALASGIYYYVLKINNSTYGKKMILLR